MKLFRQILARIIFLPLILAAGIAVTALITVHFMFKPADLEAVVTNQFQEILKRPVHIEWARLSATGEIKIKGLTVTEPGPEAVNFISAEYIYATYRLLPLLKKRLEINSVVLVSPHIELIKRGGGTWNISDIFASYRRADRGHILNKIDKTEIKDGELSVYFAKSKARYSFENLNATLKDFKPEGDCPYDASVFFKSNAFRRPVEGRLYAEGTVNFASFDWSAAELKDLHADLTLLNKTIKFTGGVKDFRAPKVSIKAETPGFKNSEMAYLFNSPFEFSAPRASWDISAVFSSSRTAQLSLLAKPMNIKADGVYDFSGSTLAYNFSISAPPLNLAQLDRYGLKPPVENPSGKVQVRIKVSSRNGKPVLSSFSAGTSWAGFKYRKLAASELEMSALLSENFANSHITVAGGKLALGSDRLAGLKLTTKISKEELSLDYSGLLNGGPVKGLVAIRQPFSGTKTVDFTGYSKDLAFSEARDLILNSRDLYGGPRKKNLTYEAELPWVRTLKNSIPSGYAAFKLLYKADKFKHEYFAADDFYTSASLKNITGDISKIRGDVSIKAGKGTFYHVQTTSEKDRVFYIFSMPLRLIYRMNRSGALKFDSKVDDISFNSIGVDYTLDEGKVEIKDFYLDGREFSAYASGQIDFTNETTSLKIYTISGKYNSMGSLPESMTDASGKPALAFTIEGKMAKPEIKMISPSDSGKIIKEAARKGVDIDFARIDRFAGGKQ